MLTLDDRIGSAELKPYIAKHIPCTLSRLPFGDAAFLGQGPDGPVPVGVERKVISDLCSSMTSGRLGGHQILGLKNTYFKVYLLVEGIYRGNPDSGILEVRRYGQWKPLSLGRRKIMFHAVANYINSLCVACGFLYWSTATIQESGAWLSRIVRWWSEPWGSHRSFLQFYTPAECVTLSRPVFMQRVIKELDNVGYAKSVGLAAAYPNTLSLALASEQDIAAVEYEDENKKLRRIGKSLAKSIARELRGE